MKEYLRTTNGFENIPLLKTWFWCERFGLSTHVMSDIIIFWASTWFSAFVINLFNFFYGNQQISVIIGPIISKQKLCSATSNLSKLGNQHNLMGKSSIRISQQKAASFYLPCTKAIPELCLPAQRIDQIACKTYFILEQQKKTNSILHSEDKHLWPISLEDLPFGCRLVRFRKQQEVACWCHKRLLKLKSLNWPSGELGGKTALYLPVLDSFVWIQFGINGWGEANWKNQDGKMFFV